MLVPFINGDHQCSNELAHELNINECLVLGKYAFKSADVKCVGKSS